MSKPSLSRTVIGLAALLLLPVGAQAQLDDQVLFRYQGLEYLASDLPEGQRQALFELEQEHYQKRRQLIDDALVQVYLETQAEQRDIGVSQMTEEFFAVELPDDAATRAFYEQNKQRIRAPYEQVKDRIAQLLIAQQVEARKGALIEELKASDKYQSLLREPQPPVVEIAIEGRPFRGAAEAPITLVEFSDFQCPHCKRAAPVAAQMVERYPGKVRLVYMDFPINPSGISRTVARGGVCAAEQERFWEYHDLAFEQQDRLSKDSPRQMAGTLGLDLQLFETCLAGEQSESAVARSSVEGDRLGVNATPTFYLNGRRLVLEDLDDGLSGAIEAALQADQGS